MLAGALAQPAAARVLPRFRVTATTASSVLAGHPVNLVTDLTISRVRRSRVSLSCNGCRRLIGRVVTQHPRRGVQRFRGLNLILGRGQYLEVRVARRHYVGRFARLTFNSRGRLVYRRPGCLRAGRHVRCPAAALRGEPVENDAVTVVSRPKQVPATIEPSTVQSASSSTLNPDESGIIWYGAPQPDTAPPQTAITGGPAPVQDVGTATFSFISNEPGSRFECMHNLDGWTPCSSGRQSYGSLYVGTHWFAVRAVDQAGNVDPSPALQSWLQNPSPGSHPFEADDGGSHYLVPVPGSADFQPYGAGWSDGSGTGSRWRASR